ncbi:MAG: saccharopine dehydrogenase NADP-binding domain-containing protein [Candidatus Heimdallarchaeota archaeon]|nr:saccharopine dehydrogenase NADP-binding domain-containing protein [Candidatus Heimdallarchaeota archaeon]
MPNYAVLGLGMMGSAICFDLLTYDPSSQVFGFDKNLKAHKKQKMKFKSFEKRFHTFSLDLNLKDSQKTHILRQILTENDISVVFGAIDYKFNYWLTKLCILVGCSFVDLGGNPTVVQEQRTLEKEAQKANVTIIPDLGLAPGLINIIAAYGMRKFDSIKECHLRGGGLPQEPKTILKYQQVFSIRGLTNEFLEDARVVRNGKVQVVPSLTELEKLSFPEPWGELEAFQSAGGSSSLPELYENQIDELTYKTIRFPGHAQFFKFLKDFELLSGSPYPKHPSVTPREVIEYYLSNKLPRGQPDAVLARITITGEIKDKYIKHTYQLIDLMDKTTGYSAMARTTSYPTSIIGQFIAHKKISSPGVVYAEIAVPADLLLQELEKRSIKFEFQEKFITK